MQALHERLLLEALDVAEFVDETARCSILRRMEAQVSPFPPVAARWAAMCANLSSDWLREKVATLAVPLTGITCQRARPVQARHGATYCLTSTGRVLSRCEWSLVTTATRAALLQVGGPSMLVVCLAP